MTAFSAVKKEIQKETVGQKLKKARLEKGVSLEEVEAATKIRVRFLKALEEGDWSAFASPVYAQGFLKSYCRYLNLPLEPILSEYKREIQIFESFQTQPFLHKKEIRFPRVYLTPATLAIVLVSMMMLAIIGYIVYQVLGFAASPYLLIYSPNQGAIVTKSPVLIEGKTSRGASLRINGQLVSVNADGGFKQEVALEEGDNLIMISAVNKAGKKTEKELVVVYQPEGP
jgi:cytoskeletal protein RodZ